MYGEYNLRKSNITQHNSNKHNLFTHNVLPNTPLVLKLPANMLYNQNISIYYRNLLNYSSEMRSRSYRNLKDGAINYIHAFLT